MTKEKIPHNKTTEKFIEEMFEQGILVNEELLAKQNHPLDENLIARLKAEEDLLVLNDDYTTILGNSSLVDWYDIDKSRVDVEKDRDEELYQSQLQGFTPTKLIVQALADEVEQNISAVSTTLSPGSLSSESNITSSHEDNFLSDSFDSPLPSLDIINKQEHSLILHSTSTVSIIISYQNIPRKYLVEDFTNFFLSRYRFLENILRNRKELSGTISIKRILAKSEKEKITLIGIIRDINETKTGNLVITIEDLTGEIKIIVSKAKQELYQMAKDLIVDEVVGVMGTFFDKVIFVDSFVWPDVPQDHELKKGHEEEYVIFLSDIHVGSKLFLKEEFNKFLEWINGRAGSEEQRAVAQKVKYIFIAGDLVDGIGIYPSQQEELEIDTIEGQYVEFTRLIKEIPAEKQIIICPGNHDIVHLAEPQPTFYKEFAPELHSLPNVILVTNPAVVNIGKNQNFSGFDVLMYHGYSFDYYVANVESIRTQGGYRRSDLIMKFLLKRRHLAPSFKSTPYYPSHTEDPLLIRTIPDFFITGHIHYSKQANYRGVTMISGSCWQGKTSFQEKLGHEPEPARVPIVNLQTRQIKVLRFG